VHSRTFPINVEVRGFCAAKLRLRKVAHDLVAENKANSQKQSAGATRFHWLPGRTHRKAMLSGLLATAALLGCGLPGVALEPSTPLANYGRQTWVMENGLPQNTVQALVQTRDGFVWLGTEVGLVRFDGNGFQVFDKNSTPALPGNDVRCLLETRDGALWIGTSEGLARWKDGVVQTYGTQEGLTASTINGLTETIDHVVWVWAGSGLTRFKDGHFQEANDGSGHSIGSINSIAPDSFGALWVGTSTGVFSWEHEKWFPLGDWSGPVGRNFVSAGPDWSVQFAGAFGVSQQRQSGWHGFAFKPPIPSESIIFLTSLHGALGAANTTTLSIFGMNYDIARFNTGAALPGNRIQTIYADREGSMWIGTNNGLVRFVLETKKIQRFPVTDPLATASVLALMEDAEGNLWVGTETGGLHILRDQRFRTLGAREGLASDATTAVVEDKAGTLWVGTNGSGLNALRNSTGVAEAKPALVKNYTVRDGLLSDVILSLAAAPNGDLWVGTPDGLNRFRNGRIDAYTSADGLPDDFIRSLLTDSDGSLWIGTRRGLTHLTGKTSGPDASSYAMRFETFTQDNGLGSNLVGAMARDSKGDLWVATFAGLSRLHGETITNYTTANGLSSNVITALLPRENGTLLIGAQEHGWNLWDGQRFVSQKQSSIDSTSIHAILDDGNNHLWFATANGIARCDCAGSAMQGTQCSNWIEFGAADGLRSRETATNSHPSAWRTRDGHLWFATPKGLVEVDPAHFPVNTVPPPVALERFVVDDVAQPLRGASSVVEILAGHVHFQFDYAGLSFAAPQKVRYRFKLEGFDRSWTDAGSRRSAYYTNIPPGHYTFRVQAANNDGLWSTEGAALTFELRPHFYQTFWFYSLLLAVTAGLIVLLLRLRLRRAEGEFRAVLGERNRIAREIHDTLAQGYVGISVQLEVLAELLRHKKTEAAEKHLDLTRGYVREGLADARQSIWALRSQDSGETTLPVRLRRMVEADGGHGLEAKFSIFGAYRAMSPGTEQEFLRVAQEAIHNVKKHAGARHLFVQLEYGPDKIALEVRDDGRGFAAEQESSPGHFGLTGMRERAAAIGGRLEVTSESGMGTTVRLQTLTPRETKEQMREPS